MQKSRRFSALYVILIGLVLGACGEKRRASPPPPCDQGVDQRTCGLKVTGGARWLRHYNVYDSEQDKKENRHDTEVDIFTEFNRLENGSEVWRRSLTYTKMNETPKTMILYGNVEKITPDEIQLSLTSTTCDGVDQNFYLNSVDLKTLYYSRNGDQLSLQKNKIKIETSGRGGLGGLFSDLMVASVKSMFEMMVDGTVDAFKSAFTFGLLRDQMKGGEGLFRAVNDRELVESRFAYGQIGCFVARDGHFIVGSDQPTISRW